MKIWCADVDGHNWPNLCLMKLSAYHKGRGATVEMWRPEGWYNFVYKSRGFTDTYSKDNIYIANADHIIRGGTGYGPGSDLPDVEEHQYPDYSLYLQFSSTAYGFLTRGCHRSCGFCIVSGKEGRRSRQVADLSKFWNGQKEIKLLDPNLLVCPNHEHLLVQLAESHAYGRRSGGIGAKAGRGRGREVRPAQAVRPGSAGGAVCFRPAIHR